jgi:hypothetical protein
MKIVLLVLFAGCATPAYVDYSRLDAPLYPEPPGDKYLDRPDVQRALEPPFKPEPAPTPRP